MKLPDYCRALLLCCGMALVASQAHGQTQPPAPPQGRPPATLPGPPATLPQVKGQARNLDFLFQALRAAPDEDSAKYTEGRIWSMWLNTPSDTTNLLMSRVSKSVETKDMEVAIKLLDALVEIRPDYAEAWNRRATLKFMQKDFPGALADLRMVLSLEPRHFGALAGLGVILQEIGEEKRALEAFRRALEIHPRMERIPDQVKTLTEKVEGRDI